MRFPPARLPIHPLSGYCSPDNIVFRFASPFHPLGRGLLPLQTNSSAAADGIIPYGLLFQLHPAIDPNAATGHPDAQPDRHTPVTKAHRTTDGIATQATKGS